MKNLPTILLFFLLITACTSKPKDVSENKTPVPVKKDTIAALVVSDTTPRVTGIGGVFFGSQNPKETREWYGKNLGLTINEYGSVFEFRNANRPDEVNYLSWSPFKEGNAYFKPSKKDFMINYRVQNIEGLVRNLKANGVTVVDSIEAYDYGKFVHIMDPDGNKIELWEPVDHVLTNMGGQTTK